MAIKFEIGEPKKVTLAFDSPKVGTSQHGPYYLYGIKSDINSDENSFFATGTLHNMIQLLGCKEGDEICIEKFPPDDGMKFPYFKVDGQDMSEIERDVGGGSGMESKKLPDDNELVKLRMENMKLRAELQSLKTKTESRPDSIDSNDIPF